MRPLTIAACVAAVFMQAAAAQAAPGAAQPRQAAVSPQARLELEATYRNVRQALLDRNYPAFLQLVIPARKGKAPPREVFDKIAVHLLDDYPDLETLNFVKIERSGAWAGYYAENRIADPDRTDILMFAFRRNGDNWQLSGRVMMVSIPQVRGQHRTLNEISLNPKFRLPGQRGYRE
jgi:hypothetical protein